MSHRRATPRIAAASSAREYRAFLRSRWPARTRLLALYALPGTGVFFALDVLFLHLLGLEATALEAAAFRLPWGAVAVAAWLAQRLAPRSPLLPGAVIAGSVLWTWGNAWAYVALGLAGTVVQALGVVVCFLTAATFMPLTRQGRIGVFALMAAGQLALDLLAPDGRPLAIRLAATLVVCAVITCVAVIFEDITASQRRAFALHADLERTVAALGASRAQMEGAAGGVAGSVVQLEASAAELLRQAVASGEEGEALAEASARMAREALALRERSRESAETAAAAQRQARSIGALLDRIEAGVRDVQAAATRTEQSYRTFQRRAESVGAFADTASDVAVQTHMLAVNAGIEAASAGEHGRGFAVIAQEIRKLAGDSGRAAQEIAQVVSEIGRGMDALLASIEGVREETGLLGAAFGEARTGLEEVRATVTRLGEAMQENARDANAQADASARVSGSSDRVGALLASLEKVSSDVAATSGALGRHATGLREATELAGRAGRLR